MSAVARKGSADLQGRYIFAYRHFRTNQVIYTFDRKIKQRDINAQLPDLGANTRPAEVRPDLWRPYWTLIFPRNKGGYHQGQEAYRLLRRWRAAREIAGQRPPELSRPYSEEQIEKLRERLQDRGGDKKETVWDLIKREKKKLRIKSIMNQKATSVADLAHVLKAQHGTGEAREQERQKELRPLELETLWSNGHDYEANADRTIAELKRQQSELQHIYQSNPGKILTTPPVLALRKQIDQSKKKLATIVFAAEVVMKAKADLAKEQGYEIGTLPKPDLKSYLSRASWKQTDEVQTELKRDDDPFENVPADILTREAVEPLLPSWIGSGQRMPEELWASAPEKIQQRITPHWSPKMSVDGVEIRWEDPLDAEFAKEWPGGIFHRPMGVAKNIANDPEMPPLMTVEDWKEREAVRRSVNRLKKIEELSPSEQADENAMPRYARRNEQGLIEHVYREARQPVGLSDEPEAFEDQQSGEQADEAPTRRKKSPDYAKIFKKHAHKLEHGHQQHPVVESIPVYGAPVAERLRV